MNKKIVLPLLSILVALFSIQLADATSHIYTQSGYYTQSSYSPTQSGYYSQATYYAQPTYQNSYYTQSTYYSQAGYSGSQRSTFFISSDRYFDSVPQGKSTTVALSANLISGTPSPVSFSSTVPANGISFNFVGGSCTPNPKCTLPMIITIAPNAPTGSYILQIGGATETDSARSIFVLNITSASQYFQSTYYSQAGYSYTQASYSAQPAYYTQSAYTSGTNAAIITPGSAYQQATYSSYVQTSYYAQGSYSAQGSYGTPCIITVGTGCVHLPYTQASYYNQAGYATTFSNTSSTQIKSSTFFISGDTYTGSVQQGASRSSMVYANFLTGDPKAIYFSAASPTPGVSVSFNPNPCVPSIKCGSLMTIAASSTAKTGTYIMTINGHGGPNPSDGGVNSATGIFVLSVTAPTQYFQSAYYSQAGYSPSQTSYYSQASYYTQPNYYTQSSYYSQSAYSYAQPTYYTQSSYYSQSAYPYTQSSYYSQNSYYSQSAYGYSQPNYYTQASYYGQGSYSYFQSSYYGQSGYAYTQSSYYTQAAYLP